MACQRSVGGPCRDPSERNYECGGRTRMGRNEYGQVMLLASRRTPLFRNMALHLHTFSFKSIWCAKEQYKHGIPQRAMTVARNNVSKCFRGINGYENIKELKEIELQKGKRTFTHSSRTAEIVSVFEKARHPSTKIRKRMQAFETIAEQF